MPYAAATAVSIDRTKAEIEAALSRYGADKFSSGWDDEHGTVFVNFRCRERFIRFVVAMPKPGERRFTHAKGRGGFLKARTAARALAEFEQERRSVWRRLLLVIRAKLESVEAKIETFESAFLAQVVTPDGSTMGDWAKDRLAIAYSTGQMPATLIGLPPHAPEVKS